MIFTQIDLADHLVLTGFPVKYSAWLFLPASKRRILNMLKKLGLTIELRFIADDPINTDCIDIVVNGEFVGVVFIEPESDWVELLIRDLTELAEHPDKYGFA